LRSAHNRAYHDPENQYLLNTIKLPRVLKQLQNQLPKPKYKRQLSQQTRAAGLNIVQESRSYELKPRVAPSLDNEEKKQQPLNNYQPAHNYYGQPRNAYDDGYQNKENYIGNCLRYRGPPRDGRSADPSHQRPNIREIVANAHSRVNEVLSRQGERGQRLLLRH